MTEPRDALLGDRADRIVASWALAIARRPRFVATMCVALLVGISLGALRLRVAMSVEDLLLEDDPYRIAYNDLRADFPSDEAILVLVGADDVFAPEFLRRLERFHHALESQLPYVQDVESLINARVTRADGDSLTVEGLFDEWPRDAAELAARREAALSNPAYRNVFLAPDARTTTLVVKVAPPPRQEDPDADVLGGFSDPAESGGPTMAPLLRADETRQLIASLDRIVAEFRAPHFRVGYTGNPPMADALTAAVVNDLGVFSALSILVIGATLSVVFQRASGVVLPLFVSLLPLTATFGVMGYLDLSVTPATQILPSFLLSVSVAQCVHLLSTFYRQYDGGLPLTQALADAFSSSGIAVVLANVTTAFGMASFVGASIRPVAELGVAGAVGVLLTLVTTLGLLPALLVLSRLRRRPEKAIWLSSWVGEAIARMGIQSVRHPWRTVGVWGVAVALSSVGMANLRVHNDATEWLPESHWFPQATRWADRALGGSLPIAIVIDSGTENGLFEPAMLQGIDALERDARSLQVGKARASASLSLATVVKEIHRALNGGSPSAYRIPDHRALVAQELLLFESQGADEIEPLVDPQFRKALVTLMVPHAEQGDYLRYVDALRQRIDGYLEQARVSISGVTVLSARSNELMVSSMVRSAGAALLLIAPVMLLVIRDIRVGLVAIVPNVVPVVIGIGFMHVVGVRLDVFTALIASLAMGIAVDDTIHFLHGFRQNYARLEDLEQAVAETLRTTGSGMVAMSITLGLGFLTFVAAEMRNVVHFGLVTMFVILIAMVAELHLSPALLKLVVEPRPHRRAIADREPHSLAAAQVGDPIDRPTNLARGEHGG